MARTKGAPRIYCLPATGAPVVAVFRRGPSEWSHVGRWDLQAMRYEPGAWLRARIFPRRSDLSPDGRYLSYFAHDPRAKWEHGDAYVAVSKLPWLTALHAFGTCGTWTRGYRFLEPGETAGPDDEQLPNGFHLRAIPIEQFANERRRGWVETADCPSRRPGDAWDQERNVRLQKPQPGGKAMLMVESLGHAGGEFGVGQAVDGMQVRYSLACDGEPRFLDDLQWADWDARGRLLVATRDGRIQLRGSDGNPVGADFEANLAELSPQPGAAPDWADNW